MVSQPVVRAPDVQALLNDGTAVLASMPTIKSLVMVVTRTETMRLSQDFTSKCRISRRARSPRRDSGPNCFNNTESLGSQPLQQPPHKFNLGELFLNNAVMSAFAPKSRHMDAQ
jgi:hypothetical protein